MSYLIKKYGATWCSHCRAQEKEFIVNPPKCPVESFDVDEMEDDELDILKVRSLPLVILFKDETEIKRWVGHVSSNEINELIEE